IREIKGRMKAVGNIERITKTMQLIASARFQAMQKKATQSQAYTQKIGEMVGELAAALGTGGDISHPLISPPDTPANKELVLVLTSERGLCGAYNGNVMRTGLRYVRDEQGLDQTQLEVVGKKGQAFCKFNNLEVAESYTFGDSPAYEDVEQLAQKYMDAFTAGQYDAVKVVYMKFESMSRQTPTVQTLLPLEPPVAAEDDSNGPSNSVYEFSPDAETMLAELLPVTVKTTLYQCFMDAVVSEQLARMVAMKAATDAAGKQKTSLKRQFNRARQTAITTELSEIIGGAAALE
ncbi:MAG: ATP synthase F1 subunit gamma, partial [Planctomycetota bacterium]